jgi:putative transposase
MRGFFNTADNYRNRYEEDGDVGLSLRRRGMKISSDERILGGTEFIQRLLSEVEEREKETLRLSRKKPDLTTLAKRIIKGKGIKESDLRSGMRKREV